MKIIILRHAIFTCTEFKNFFSNHSKRKLSNFHVRFILRCPYVAFIWFHNSAISRQFKSAFIKWILEALFILLCYLLWQMPAQPNYCDAVCLLVYTWPASLTADFVYVDIRLIIAAKVSN